MVDIPNGIAPGFLSGNLLASSALKVSRLGASLLRSPTLCQPSAMQLSLKKSVFASPVPPPVNAPHLLLFGHLPHLSEKLN